jgi:hypothetical protein
MDKQLRGAGSFGQFKKVKQVNADETAMKALLEYLNACEVGIAAAKRVIIEQKALEEYECDPERIHWTQKEGNKGIYERSEDSSNPDLKILVKDLEQHKGALSKNGYFYWIFQDGKTVGRKAKNTQR